MLLDVKQIVHFARGPTWVVPGRLQQITQSTADGILSELAMDEQANFTKEQIERFKSDPVYYRKFVKTVEEVVNGNFPLVSTILFYLYLFFLSYKKLIVIIDTERYGFCRYLTANGSALYDRGARKR